MKKYAEHYTAMTSYMRAFNREYDKKIDYEYGACAAISDILTEMKLLTNAEFIDYRNSLGVR